jgi:hypothetical protein
VTPTFVIIITALNVGLAIFCLMMFVGSNKASVKAKKSEECVHHAMQDIVENASEVRTIKFDASNFAVEAKASAAKALAYAGVAGKLANRVADAQPKSELVDTSTPIVVAKAGQIRKTKKVL